MFQPSFFQDFNRNPLENISSNVPYYNHFSYHTNSQSNKLLPATSIYSKTMQSGTIYSNVLLPQQNNGLELNANKNLNPLFLLILNPDYFTFVSLYNRLYHC